MRISHQGLPIDNPFTWMGSILWSAHEGSTCLPMQEPDACLCSIQVWAYAGSMCLPVQGRVSTEKVRVITRRNQYEPSELLNEGPGKNTQGQTNYGSSYWGLPSCVWANVGSMFNSSGGVLQLAQGP